MTSSNTASAPNFLIVSDQYLSPRQIVAELDRYIIGQEKAKKTVAIALRNRWRRRRVPPNLRDEILPNNIIMIGPTGVGKTEIARRLAQLSGAPFVKVEASKFTEVGYVGRDVESMIRDLMERSVAMLRSEAAARVRETARTHARERLADLLVPSSPPPTDPAADTGALAQWQERRRKIRETMLNKLDSGQLKDRYIELDVHQGGPPIIDMLAPLGMEEVGINMQEMFSNIMPRKTRKRRVRVEEAERILLQEETERLLDMDEILDEARKRVEDSGIVFIDEIDKIAGEKSKTGPDVSREGVQRDLLPIVEGTTVTTKHGPIKTDHILFIAAGAFHVSKPSDLIPELQGRFPIRVELDSLSADDFERILVEPQNALVRQYTALMATENVFLTFEQEALRAIAEMAFEVNQATEDIGARRLHTILTTLLEDILFDVPVTKPKKIRITRQKVEHNLRDIIENEDMSRYIL